MRILAVNVADTAIITASPAMVTTLPETNLQNALREKVARWTSIDAQQIIAEWTSGQPINCVALYRNNFASTATWRVRLYTDTTLSTTLYDSGVVYTNAPTPLGSILWGVDPLGRSLYTDWDYGVASIWFTGVVAQAMTIDITDSDNPNGYSQASRLFVGAYLEPTAGPTRGVQLAWQENTQQVRTEGGSLRVEPGAAWRTLEVDVTMMDEAERRQIFDQIRSNGMRTDFFVSVYPGTADERQRDYELQARLTTLSPMVTPYSTFHSQKLSFGEI